MNPLNVTVYTPSFNRKDWLKGCIDSVANQDYIHKRHLIVDDHSSDGTLQFVVSLMKDAINKEPPPGAESLVVGWYNNSRLAIARLSQNSGPSNARNWAIQSSLLHTDVFGNLDSDDRYRPGYLSKLIKPFENDEVGVVYCDYEVINHASQTVVREFKEPFSQKRLLQDCLLCNNSLVKKNVLEQIGGYDPNLRVAEDWDLWIRASRIALIYHIPECLLEIHAGNHGATREISQERWIKDRQLVMRKAMESMGRI